jgi:hypothetical protein
MLLQNNIFVDTKGDVRQSTTLLYKATISWQLVTLNCSRIVLGSYESQHQVICVLDTSIANESSFFIFTMTMGALCISENAHTHLPHYTVS